MPQDLPPLVIPSRPDEFGRIIQQSRRRSAQVEPSQLLRGPPRVWSALATRRRLSAHLLKDEIPLLHDLLGPTAQRNGLIVAVADAHGRILDLSGHPGALRRAAAAGLTPGTDWSEEALGTNGIGTAAATRRPIRVVRREHLAPWAGVLTCWAAPIRDPRTGRMAGVVNLSAWPESEQSTGDVELSLLLAATFAVELDLYYRQSGRRTDPPAPSGDSDRATPPRISGLPDLRVLGRPRAVAGARHRTVDLSLRHSEVALLLSWWPDGLSAAELATALYEDHEDPGVIRAEVRRLRRVLTEVDGWEISSQPYRFDHPIRSDATTVIDLLEVGELDRAVRAYRGPVLAPSEAPGVVDIRREVHARLRTAILDATGDSGRDHAELAYDFARLPVNVHDAELWEACRRRLPPDSPHRISVRSHLAYLNSVLA